MAQQPHIFAVTGGLDLETPAITMPDGRPISMVNYEASLRGARRCDGFERYSGKPAPSAASYWTLSFNLGSIAIVAGNTVTGLTSAATAVALNAIVESGTLASSNAAGTLVLGEVVGTFVTGEALRVAGVTHAFANGVTIEHGASNDALSTDYLTLAVEYRRSLISAVTGSGPIRGVHVYNGAVYAFRDNVGATAAVMFKATTAGWVAQNLGREVGFTSGGTYEIVEGNTITGATSGATAVIGRVILTSGTWAGGTAAGRLIITGNQTGTFQAENLNVGANLNVATIGGNSTAHTLLPGGRFDFDNKNFFGSASTIRMYAADGVNQAFEWDGATFVSIITGIADDTPDFVRAHKTHLMLGFKEGSVQTSDLGEPYFYTSPGGAVEIGVGNKLTGLLAEVAGVLMIFCSDAVYILYGTAADDWDLAGLADDAGAHAWTMQLIGSAKYVDNIGVRDIRATQTYANFAVGTDSRLVQKIFTTKRIAGVLPIASMRVRAKDQYRLFFDDNTGVSIFYGKKAPEAAYFDMGIEVACACSGHTTAGDEILFAGGDNGFVYQMDKGTSYDGEEIDAYIRLNFTSCGSPQLNKRLHSVVAEIDAPANAMLTMVADFDYASSQLPAVPELAFLVSGGGGFWNEAFWNEFYWSAEVFGQAAAYPDGMGCNIGILIASNSATEVAHTIHGMRILFSPRGLKR